MKNPFKRFGSYNPSQYSGSGPSNKLIIVAGIVTFIIIIVVMFESVVVVAPVTKYKHFRNVPRMKPPFTPNLDTGNQYVIFG